MSEELDPGNFLGVASWKELHQMPAPALGCIRRRAGSWWRQNRQQTT